MAVQPHNVGQTGKMTTEELPLLVACGEWGAAEALARQALNAVQPRKTPLEAARARRLLADVLIDAGRAEEAAREIETAWAEYRSATSDDDATLAELELTAARLSLARDDWEGARKNLDHAASLLEKRTDCALLFASVLKTGSSSKVGEGDFKGLRCAA